MRDLKKTPEIKKKTVKRHSSLHLQADIQAFFLPPSPPNSIYSAPTVCQRLLVAAGLWLPELSPL